MEEYFMINHRKKKILFICIILTLIFFMLINCNNSANTNEKNDSENTTSNDDGDSGNDENGNDENENPEESVTYKEIIKNLLPEGENTYEIHYFADWDFEEDYPYNNIDNFWEETYNEGFFKFYYDKTGNKVANIRLQNNTPIKTALYNHKSNTKTIKRVKHYNSKTGEPEIFDIIEYYPNGRIKALKAYSVVDDKETLFMKIEYSEIEEKNGEYIRISRYYDEDGKEKIYAETKYQYIASGLYEEAPQYIKEEVIRYVGFGEHKDKWFSILRYVDGEPKNLDINETKTEEGKTYEQYMENNFPQFFIYESY